MAGKSQSQGSVVDGLKAIYQDVAALALAPDAGIFTQEIEALRQATLKVTQVITQKKAQAAAAMQQQQRQAVPNQMGGQMPGQSTGAPPPGAQPGTPGGPPSQGSPGLTMPNADELRRVLAEHGAGG